MEVGHFSATVPLSIPECELGFSLRTEPRWWSFRAFMRWKVVRFENSNRC